MGLLSIPGNIKQLYLPFVLDPNNNTLNKYASDSKSIDQNARAQFFSFKPRAKVINDKAGLLNICPSSLRDANFGKFLQEDISFKTLFNGKESITIDPMLNSIPGIQIREYLPDTRLDQLFNPFSDVISAVLKQLTNIAGAADDIMGLAKWVVDGGLKNFLSDETQVQKLKDTLEYIMDWLICNQTSNNRNLVQKDINTPRFSFKYGNQLGSYNLDKRFIEKVFTLPYMIYYKLQSSVTTNIYELPMKIDTAFDVHGKEGWGGSSIGFENTFLTKVPVLNKIVKHLLGNVRINYMNWWDAESGSKTEEPEITIKFSLFNDTAESARMNFIFINTIVPNNMWIQYGLFQHSSHIYDIKIDGHKRLFACAGNVKVSYKGVLRSPTALWIDNLVQKYGTKSINNNKFKENIKNNDLIKIPDIYEVELQFKSMLPQNFNTYLYQFSQNARIDIEYKKKSVYEDSSMTNFMKDMKSGLSADVKDYIENYNKPTATNTQKADTNKNDTNKNDTNIKEQARAEYTQNREEMHQKMKAAKTSAEKREISRQSALRRKELRRQRMQQNGK